MQFNCNFSLIMRRALLLFLLCVVRFPLLAQSIRGEVVDMDDKHGIGGAKIENVHTSLSIVTNSDGSFVMPAASGQLLEFTMQGYTTARVRIPQGYVPPYFRIILKKGFTGVPDVYADYTNRYDYRKDSIRYHDLYQHELDFPKMSTFDMLASPFSAMSGKNRAIWQFQDDYKELEKEKYVDKTFNENIVTKFTGLKGDSLHYYMRRYRPSYSQLKSMNDYAFFTFIRESVKHYRNINTPRNAQ